MGLQMESDVRISGVLRNRVALVVAVLLPFLLSGCGPSVSTPEQYPPPGHMRVISMTPIKVASAPSLNLIPNGSISEYWAGAPAPTGFVAPDSTYSGLTRAGDADETFASIQEWLKPDRNVGVERAFRTHLYGIASDKEFQLSVDATNVSGNPVSISLFEVGDDKKTAEPLVIDAIRLTAEKDHRQVYSTTFVTKKGVRLIVAAQCESIQSGENKVIWHSFDLVPK